MEAVKTWLEERGFDLVQEPGAPGCVIFGGVNTVFVDKNGTREARLATMLHEAGHVSIRRSRARAKKKTVSGVCHWDMSAERGRYTPRSKKRKIAVLSEEIDAWERGWALGRSLNIKLSKKKYEAVRVRALMTYVRWGASSSRK
jgi:hypothetical protein